MINIGECPVAAVESRHLERQGIISGIALYGDKVLYDMGVGGAICRGLRNGEYESIRVKIEQLNQIPDGEERSDAIFKYIEEMLNLGDAA